MTPVLADQKSAFADYYRWEEPNRDITVCLNLETANRLQEEVFGSRASSRNAGIEIGGILLGRRERDGERIITFIEDFDLVPCDHRNGPFYSLSEGDRRAFQIALSRRRSTANQGRSVLGYWRNHKRADLHLSPDDLALIQTSFAEPDDIILLVKVLPGNVCTAGFFFWDHGKIQPEFTDSEFPLIPMERADFALANESPKGGRNRWVIGTSASIAIAAAALFAVLGYHRSPSYVPPASSHVTQQEPTAERPVLPATPATRKIIADQSPKPTTGLSTSPTKQPVLPDPTGPTRETAHSEPDNAVPETRADGPETPPVQTAPALPASLPTSSPVIASSPPPTAAPPIVEKAPDISPVQSPLPQATSKLQPVEASFAGPQILHQVAPAIPLGVGPKITTNIQIDVTVTINEVGKVIGARISSTSGAAAGLLTLEALKAAQLFRFRPAQENNRPVRSDMVLTFRFAPRAK